MKINMYWKGDDWQFLNRLTVISHLQNGHEVAIYVNGPAPDNEYWISDLSVDIKDAAEVCDVSSYETLLRNNRITEPEIVRLVSDLWSFNFCYNSTELYCDSDIIALDNWNDIEEVFTTDDGEHYTVALMKSKKKYNQIYKYCIQNIKPYWANMALFTDACKLFGQKITHSQTTFHPIDWRWNWDKNGLPKLLNSTEVPASRGIHYYGFKTSKLGLDETWIPKYKTSMFSKLCERFFKNVSYRRV